MKHKESEMYVHKLLVLCLFADTNNVSYNEQYKFLETI